jgi:UDP-glucose 4-epimerase
MNVLITGGAGYIGTHTVSVLSNISEVNRIVVFDNLCHGRHGLFTGLSIAETKVVFVRGDILDTRSLKKVLDGIDVVVHLAARVSTPFASGDPHMFEQVNHWGTAELSYLLEESTVQKVIYVSSASVYGLSDEIKDVNSVPRPNTWYGTSKLRAEDMLLRLQDRMCVTVLRCANVYGYSPSIRFDAVINRFVRQSHFEGRISIEGDGRQYRPFTQIDRVADVISHCVETNLNGIYNLVDHNLPIWEVANQLKEVYPALEMIFVEQDMKRQSLRVEPSPELACIESRTLLDNIKDFTSYFSFSSFD